MQLFIADDLLRELRGRERPAGTLRCALTPGGALLALPPGTGVSAQDLYPELRVAGSGVRRDIPFVLAEVPTGLSPWVLRPALSLVDADPFRWRLAELSGFPYLPCDYQPYMQLLLERGRCYGLLVVGPDDAIFLRSRKLHGLPDEQWSRVPMTTTPVAMSSVGEGRLIAAKRFVLIGAGSIGSRMAELLVAAGAAELVIVDPDALELRNLRRHICGIEHLGRPKAEAVADVLRERGFPTQITSLVGRVHVELADHVRELIAGSDLAICTTDAAAPRQFVNHAALAAGVPCVIADVQLRPEPLAEIVVVVPGAGGCFNCWRTELEAGGVMAPPAGHDPADYPSQDDPTPSGLPMYQLTAVAAAACDLAGVALKAEPTSLKWLMALDTKVSDFPDLEEPRHPRIEALAAHPSCEVCRS